MKRFAPYLVTIGVLALLGVAFVYSGAFNVAADDPHWSFTHRVLETARERSIAARAGGIEMPKLDDPELLASGAEHYNAMCTGCHLAPGMSDTEMRAGLYPKPPNLAEHAAHRTPEQTFWIIKHGLKMTGMPAWGVTHDDRSIWGMVAFLQRLPELSLEDYRDLAAQGSGHSHGDNAHAHSEQAGAKTEPEGEHEHSEQASTARKPSSPEGGHEHSDQPSSEKKPASPAPSPGHDHSTHSHGPAKQQQPAAPQAGAPLAASTAEPIAIVESFFRALASGDTRRASNLLDPAVLIFESGGAERSRAEYASHHMGGDAKFLKSATHKLLSRTGDAQGDLAWVATEQRLASTGEKPVDVTSTETMVLRKTQDGWRIVHIHWSSRPNKPATKT